MTVNRRTVGFNFLEEPELPAPQVSEEQAEQILARALRIAGPREIAWQPAGPELHRDLRLDGAIAGVLKIANPAFNETELQAQDLAADLIAAAEPDLRVAVPLPNIAGEKCTTITGLVDGTRIRQAAAVSPGRDAARGGLPVAHRGGRSRRGGGPGEPGARRTSPIPGWIGSCNGIYATAPTLSPN